MITLVDAELRANIVRAMAHPVRLMVIDFILGGERSFSEIFGLFHLDKSTISKHLLVLKEAGIVSSRKAGREMFYKLEVPCVANFFTCATVVVQNKVEKQLQALGR